MFGTMIDNCLLDRCRIRRRTRHRLEDRGKVDLLAHLIDLLLDDRILSLHDVLDDLGLLHLHGVYDLLDMLVRNLFTGSLLGRALRQSSHPVCSQPAARD